VNDWLLTEIERGISKLLCLGLDGQPAAELIEGTIGVWYEAVTAGRALGPEDAPRIRAGFANVVTRSRRWPSPADFIEAMPKREAASVTALPVGSEERARREAIAKAALARIGAALGDDGRVERAQ
jgi:hypothetical protein